MSNETTIILDKEAISEIADQLEEELKDNIAEDIIEDIEETILYRTRKQFFIVLTGALLLVVGISFRDLIAEWVSQQCNHLSGVQQKLVSFIILAAIIGLIVVWIIAAKLDK